MNRLQAARLFGTCAALIVLALVGGAMLHKEIAPAISADTMRPHGERGPCINCHQILPATRIHGQAFMASPGVAGRVAGPIQNRPPIAAAPAVGLVQTVTAAQPAPPARQMIGPPIVEGTAAPHDWRGPCSSCHTLVGRQPAAVGKANPSPVDPWQPTPRLSALNGRARNPGRDPPEGEAFGMSVRPTATGDGGLMIVEVEGMAQRSGLMLGDIVRAVDGRVTTDIPSFFMASRSADPGRGVVFDTVRDGTSKVVIVR